MEMVLRELTIPPPVSLYWTQSGYNLKPAPQVAPDRTPEQNLDAMRRHFSRTLPRYGPHVCHVSLVSRIVAPDQLVYLQTIVNNMERRAG